jgi:IS5 family transposase
MQVDRGLENIKATALDSDQKKKWLNQVERHRDLTLKVISQTERRVIRKENVHLSEKIVSLFESHTDIIVKEFRDVQYGHKTNISSE